MERISFRDFLRLSCCLLLEFNAWSFVIPSRIDCFNSGLLSR